MSNPWVTHIGTVEGMDLLKVRVGVDHDHVTVDCPNGVALSITGCSVLRAYLQQAQVRATANSALLEIGKEPAGA